MCPDFPESAIPFRQSFMLNRPETVVPNRPEVSASDLISVFFRFFIFHTYAYFHFSSDACFLFRLIRFFRLYSCFRPSSLHSYSLLFPIFPQSRPASSGFTPASVLHPYTRIRFYFRFFPQSRPAFSGFTPVFVLHPYTRIRSYFRFSPNPAPLLPALLLFSSFIIPAFALVSDFPPILPRFFRLYSCFRPSSLHSYSFLFLIFPQSRPASSGFTPASVLYPYTAFALISDFSPNPAPLLPALLLLPSFTLIPAFALISDFPPIPFRFFRFYSYFRPLPLYPHSLLFPIFPQSRPASSGFTPVFVLHPYTRIRSYFRFSPNPAPLLPALLLFSSFIIPAFALVSDFPPILPRFFRLYSCFRPSSLYPHLLLLTSSRHIHFLWFERLHKQADADMPARP